MYRSPDQNYVLKIYLLSFISIRNASVCLCLIFTAYTFCDVTSQLFSLKRGGASDPKNPDLYYFGRIRVAIRFNASKQVIFICFWKIKWNAEKMGISFWYEASLKQIIHPNEFIGTFSSNNGGCFHTIRKSSSMSSCLYLGSSYH